ncbi:SnoaL-like domain-containing protein [Ramlibacter sp. G-1-2-2]|uniref:SnoaL-like domain-containing protein n=1 Tax=Ramlibacter agri TaxID=2728837 RepID=A0A848HH62_9BURK|nr:aromatic-ring-hydroxylating dioxygenase subunit beta [Ramlibacter agri]NML47863.1 SnoaL-like domain-containing protein [Ramlibacter agri]
MNEMELQFAVNRFVQKGAMLLDRDRLEEWADAFDAGAKYVVLPRDNKELGYGIGLMHCASKAALQDRISVLRHANKFNPHWDRHILGGTDVVAREGDTVVAHTSFMVVQTTLNGVSELYCAGCYEDRIRLGERLSLADRVVVLDTFSVKNCMATPL